MTSTNADKTITEIKKLYYNATRTTIAKDVARAVALLKTLPSEDERERAAVYMDGLSQMRSEWGVKGGAAPKPSANAKARGK